MKNQFDAIVVGGGHNGLCAASYLARGGLKPIVLEARSKTGGAATTDSPWPEAPEFKVTRLSYVMSLMPQRILNDLSLARHGYRVLPMGPNYQAFADGGSMTLYSDEAARNYAAISKWSKRDADTMPKWDAWLGGMADVLGPLLMQVPPHIGSKRPAELAKLLKLSWSKRGLGVKTTGDVTRLMTMSIGDLLNDWFESPQIKGALALNGVIGTWAGPYEPGTAYVMAHHSIGDIGDGHLGSWGPAEGGMGAVADAFKSAALEHGVTIRTDARVAQVITRNGAVTSVVMENGDEIQAPVVVTTLHPKTAFLDQMDARELPADFVTDIERWRSRSGVVKINLALAELPNFTADPGTNRQEHHTGFIARSPSLEYVERAFQDAREGRAAARPFSECTIPTTFDKTLSPEGTHIMSMFTQWVPESWASEPHQTEVESYADRVIETYDELAPNFKSSILHRDVVSSYEMEHEYGLIGGNIFHGELSVNQLFHMRPAPGYADYRTPIKGLYNGSSATHAGGGVCGIPGYQASQAALTDAKRSEKGAVAARLRGRRRD